MTPGAVLEQRLAAAHEQAARLQAAAPAGQAGPAALALLALAGSVPRGQGAAGDGLAQTPGLDEVVAIHVVDDLRGVTRDFFVGRSVLVANMRYFASYLREPAKVDISVN